MRIHVLPPHSKAIVFLLLFRLFRALYFTKVLFLMGFSQLLMIEHSLFHSWSLSRGIWCRAEKAGSLVQNMISLKALIGSASKK